MSVRFCGYCGSESTGEAFCGHCGAQLMEHTSAGNPEVAGFIDVETTGLNPARDQIVELAIALFAYKRDTGEIVKVLEEYSGLREPTCPISPEALRVHRITGQMVRGKHLDHARIEAMIGKANFLVAHNASFDRGFVTGLFPLAGSKQWICSMNDINWRAKGFGSKSLQNLLHDHGIRPSEAHRAADDVRSALELLGRLSQAGRPYLSELLQRYQPQAPPSSQRSGEQTRDRRATPPQLSTREKKANPQVVEDLGRWYRSIVGYGCLGAWVDALLFVLGAAIVLIVIHTVLSALGL